MKKPRIFIFYSPDNSESKKMAVRAQSLVPEAIPCTLEDPGVTSIEWDQVILSILERPETGSNERPSNSMKINKGVKQGKQELMNLIKKDLAVVNKPLAVKGTKAFFFNDATDVYQLIDLSEPVIFV